jgi:uncharacterized protein (DUF433 family)
VSQNDSIPGRILTDSLAGPSKSWVQKTPEVCGGDACIRTTRIPVWSLVEARRLGFSDQELLNHYDPPLTQADLDAAWAYFDNHRNEIEQAIRENEDA